MNLRLEDGRSEERSGGKASNSTNHIIIINDEMPSFSATDVEESKSEMLPVKTQKGQPGSEDHLKQKKSSVLNFSAGRTQVLALRDMKLENETLCPKEHHPSANTQRRSLTVPEPEIFPPRPEKDHPNSEGYLDTMENTGVTFIDENGLEIIPPGVKINDLKILQIKIEEDDPEDSWSSGSEDSDSPETVTTPKEPFVCTYCGKEFNKKFNFQIHQLVHTGEKPFTCSECGKSFSQKRILQTHLKVHTGEKPFTCTECGKCFAQKIHLHTHQKVHTGEKPHTCPDCGKCFSVKSNLRKHQIVHTGTKPFTCTECGKSFSEKGSLQRHLKVHTGEKPFKCTECGKGFTRKIHLTKHHKLHIGV